MKSLRRIHTFLGCFFAPLLLFFVATGWYQTVNPDRKKGGAEADTLVGRLSTVHVEQHFPFLFWAYNIIWVLIAGYLLTLGLRQRRIQRQIDRLKEALKMEERS